MPLVVVYRNVRKVMKKFVVCVLSSLTSEGFGVFLQKSRLEAVVLAYDRALDPMSILVIRSLCVLP